MNRCMQRLISVLLLSLCLSSQSFADRRVLDKTVVAVNDEVILESDIDRFIKKSKSKSFQELFGGIEQTDLSKRATVLQLLIEEKLIDQQVRKLDLKVSDEEIDGQINSIVQRNGITRSQLEERLKQLGTSITEYRDGIRRQLERRNLIDREIRPNLQISEEKLKQLYRKQAGQSSTEYQIAHIFIDDTEKGGVSASKRAQKIWQEVKDSPDKFDQFVKDFSDDSSTAESGGGLGYFSASALVEEFRKVIPKTPVGQVTSPIKTAAGYHIVKVKDQRAGNYDTLSKDVKAQLREQLAGSELERNMKLWLERKLREAHIRRFE